MSEIISISPRASYSEKENELSIVISSAPDKKKANTVGIIFLLWIIGGALVIYNYFGLTDQKSKVMTMVWIAFWGYFCYIMGKAFTWQRSGREILKVKDGKLYYKKDTGGRGWVQTYELEKIEKLRVSEKKDPAWTERLGMDFWSVDCDSIRFNYGDKEIAMGYKLTEAELKKVMSLLKKEARG